MKKLKPLLSLTLPLLLSACASKPLTEQQLHKVKPMGIAPPAKGPEGNLYHDQTSEALTVVGSQTGLVGALLFGGIAAVNQSSGTKRFEPATSGSGEAILAALIKATRDSLVGRGYMNAKPGGELGTLKLETVSFGVNHEGYQRFKAAVSVFATVEAPPKEKIWRQNVQGMSLSTFTKEEVLANPKIYRDAAIEAARSAGEQLASKM